MCLASEISDVEEILPGVLIWRHFVLDFAIRALILCGMQVQPYWIRTSRVQIFAVERTHGNHFGIVWNDTEDKGYDTDKLLDGLFGEDNIKAAETISLHPAQSVGNCLLRLGLFQKINISILAIGWFLKLYAFRGSRIQFLATKATIL